MSTTVIDNIDWLKYMRDNASGEPELFDPETGLPDSWVTQQCRKAALLCLAECPAVRSRLRRRRLSEADFAGVVCDMVLRLARQYKLKSESNGNYSYTRRDDQPVPPGYDPSPRLFLSKSERSILNGYAGSQGAAGHISLGFDPGYGG
ncbi:hypothetical protein [Bifidobacterium myosotis]|uniref:Phage protein Gp19/Gp15/Gp42 n=1 Tax=Bifidobacterium myosotis TaxID=1630166 RepID=A0A5M9ZI34_9BIFI|nr:hypothetical protein [Bifidobacterium myosotis]KAA8827246.1 hypothetical protein EMO91_09375 [Bifidobacterium myosotis]